MEITIDKDYLTIDGKPRFLYGGDLSYGRTPRRRWRESVLKMKAAGMNCVTFYCVWLLHEPERGAWDFEGDHDLGAFVDLVAEAGMFAVCRLGPFVHGEYRDGGLPHWLVEELGPRARSNDPEYLGPADEWYRKLATVVRPRLAPNGGPIVLLQLENELGSAGCKGDDLHRGSSDPDENVRHVLHFHQLAQELGMAGVPIIDINHIPDKETVIPNLVDAGGGYPINCFYCDGDLSPFSTAWWDKHQRPKVTIETGCGMFARFYDPPPYRNTNGFQGPLVPPSIVEAFVQQQVAEGANGVNVFVFHDGQHLGPHGESMTAERNMNYQAPVSVVGSLRESYKALKRLGWFVRAFEPELLGSHPQADWARAVSHGVPHPGAGNGGDLFAGYGEAKELPDHLRHVKELASLARVTTGLNLGESNFLFLRNVANGATAWRRDVRVAVSPSRLACEVFQEYPKRAQMELPPQTCKIMPFFVRLAPKTFLEYSTGTLLDRRPFGEAVQVVVHATGEETVETRLVVRERGAVRCSGDLLALWESPNAVTLLGRTGGDLAVAELDGPVPVRYVLMAQSLAGEIWDLAAPGNPCVTASNLRVLESRCEGDATTALVEAEAGQFHLYVLSPRAPLTLEGAELSGVAAETGPGLCRMSGRIGRPAPELDFDVKLSGDNLTYEAALEPGLLDGLHDLALRCEFDGAYGKAFLDGELISDHPYGKFLFWEIGLRGWLRRPSRLKLEFEGARRADVRVVPIVQTELRIKWDPPPGR